MPRRRTLAALALAPLAVACASSPPPAPVRAPDEVAAPADDAPRRCPLDTTDLTARVVDTPVGADLVVTTTDDADALYTELVALAEIHNEAHGEIAELPGTETAGPDLTAPASPELSRSGVDNDGEGTIAGEEDPRETVAAERDEAVLASTARRPGPDILILTRSHARVFAITDGVRVAYAAAPSDRAALRRELRRHAADDLGRCAR